ncbi:MAG: hypothetical protein WA989_04990, partial [Henriciella sp.]|uniref:hypothetical protein n=1 Tax=Henriciella sp. TaxID=1968823 RepID=UPI003C72BBC3
MAFNLQGQKLEVFHRVCHADGEGGPLLSIQLSRSKASLALLGVSAAAVSLSTFYVIGQAKKAEAQPRPPVSLAVPLAA